MYLLDMCMSYVCTAEGIFLKIQDALLMNEILWDSCVGISIKTRIKAVNSSVYVMGCPCHIVHNTLLKKLVLYFYLNLHQRVKRVCTLKWPCGQWLHNMGFVHVSFYGSRDYQEDYQQEINTLINARMDDLTSQSPLTITSCS